MRHERAEWQERGPQLEQQAPLGVGTRSLGGDARPSLLPCGPAGVIRTQLSVPAACRLRDFAIRVTKPGPRYADASGVAPRMVLAEQLLLGDNLLPLLVLALGAAMVVGNGLALLRPPPRPGELERAPAGPKPGDGRRGRRRRAAAASISRLLAHRLRRRCPPPSPPGGAEGDRARGPGGPSGPPCNTGTRLGHRPRGGVARLQRLIVDLGHLGIVVARAGRHGRILPIMGQSRSTSGGRRPKIPSRRGSSSPVGRARRMRRSEQMARPNLALRLLIGAAVGVALGAAAWTGVASADPTVPTTSTTMAVAPPSTTTAPTVDAGPRPRRHRPSTPPSTTTTTRPPRCRPPSTDRPQGPAATGPEARGSVRRRPQCSPQRRPRPGTTLRRPGRSRPPA